MGKWVTEMAKKTKAELKAMLQRERNPKVKAIIANKIKGLDAIEASTAQQRLEEEIKTSRQYQRFVGAGGVEYYKDLATGQYIVPSETGETQFSHSELAEVRQMGLPHLQILKNLKDLFHARKVDIPYEPQPERMKWE